jgi:uncharacterized membrane protein YvlD (DUF360 family)
VRYGARMKPWLLYWIAVAMVLFVVAGSVEAMTVVAVAAAAIAVIAWMVINRRRREDA